jgi:hypothetical protein
MGGEDLSLGLEAKLPTGPQTRQKHQHPRPDQRRSRIVQYVRVARLRYPLEPRGKNPAKNAGPS